MRDVRGGRQQGRIFSSGGDVQKAIAGAILDESCRSKKLRRSLWIASISIGIEVLPPVAHEPTLTSATLFCYVLLTAIRQALQEGLEHLSTVQQKISTRLRGASAGGEADGSLAPGEVAVCHDLTNPTLG
jgi:hypothetical protein